MNESRGHGTFFCIRPSPGLLPVLGPLEQYMKPTLDAALLSSCLRHVSLTLEIGPGILHWELQHSLSATERSMHHTYSGFKPTEAGWL